MKQSLAVPKFKFIYQYSDAGMTADYQFQLPRILSYSIPVTIACALIVTTSLSFIGSSKLLSYSLASVAILLSIAYLAISLYVYNFTNLDTRLADRDFLLNQISWDGSENVLDVGCGNGILIFSAAKHLTTGRAIGVDMWAENSGDNKKEIFERNAEIEGVQSKVELHSEDARKLPYADGEYDVVLCGLTMHHILHDSGADKAIQEMVRVLKPKGTIAVYDVPIAIMSTARLLKKENVETAKLNSKMLIGVKSPPMGSP